MKHTKKLSNEDLVNKKNLQNLVNDGRFRVAIFGSARITHEDTLYQEIADLATMLAKNNFDIVTGGGPGAMEAAAFGHQRATLGQESSKAIGINIELPFEQIPNKYLEFTDTTSTLPA